MKVTIESTDRIVFVEQNGISIPARVWEGRTESGIFVSCLMTRIAAPTAENLEQFNAELQECRPPERPEVYPEAIPLRMII